MPTRCCFCCGKLQLQLQLLQVLSMLLPLLLLLLCAWPANRSHFCSATIAFYGAIYQADSRKARTATATATSNRQTKHNCNKAIKDSQYALFLQERKKNKRKTPVHNLCNLICNVFLLFAVFCIFYMYFSFPFSSVLASAAAAT